MCDLLNLIFEWLSEQWWMGLWAAVNSFALIATLVYVYRYTKATSKMADATQTMADAAEVRAKADLEEMLARKRPVIRIGAEETIPSFPTTFCNIGLVHAKMRVLATIVFNGKKLELFSGHHYDGKQTWVLQAGGGLFGQILQGHLSFDKLYEYNRIEPPDFRSLEARITIEAWVVSIEDSDSDLYDDANKNPIMQWYWKPSAPQWVPEVAPDMKHLAKYRSPLTDSA